MKAAMPPPCYYKQLDDDCSVLHTVRLSVCAYAAGYDAKLPEFAPNIVMNTEQDERLPWGTNAAVYSSS